VTEEALRFEGVDFRLAIIEIRTKIFDGVGETLLGGRNRFHFLELFANWPQLHDVMGIRGFLLGDLLFHPL
jgi:hypothetical protein